MNRAEALRWWQAGYQAGHQAAEHEQRAAARWDRLVTSYRAQQAADQQAKIDALLLETIDVLARLLNGRSPRQQHSLNSCRQHGITAKSCQNMHT
jgi:hypothetical protein